MQDPQHMATLDYIESEIKKHKYPITKELETILQNKGENLRKKFDEYARVQKEFDNFMRKILRKYTNPKSEAPGVNPVLTDLINQIQTHGDNIVVKQQGQQLTIKATLNKNNQNKTDQWGEF